MDELFSAYPNGRVRGKYFGGVPFAAKNRAELESLEEGGRSYIIDQFTFSDADSPSDELRFARGTLLHSKIPDGQPQANYFFRYRESDAYFDEFGFYELANRPGDYKSFGSEARMSLARIVSKLRVPTDGRRGDTHDSLVARLDQNIDDLNSLSSSFISRMAEAREADEVAFQKRLEKLEEEYQARTARLQKDRDDLEVRRKELDDREPQHERRRLRKDLTRQLNEHLERPDSSSFTSRHLVHLLYIGSGLVFLAISFALVLRMDMAANVTSGPFWVQSLKSLASGLGGAAFIWAGLSGLSKSISKASENTRAIQRYAFDMDRASWVVETLLQMNSLEKAQVPDAWLEAACRDLFKNTHDTAAREPQSLDALASLLDATAKARVGTNGFEFELDKRAARRLADQV